MGFGGVGANVVVWGDRYNTFYVLYPLGISSECLMVYKALGPAGELVSPLYRWFLIAVLGIYVPGEFIFLLSWGEGGAFVIRVCANLGRIVYFVYAYD